ncbi:MULTISPECIES: hypothetical protein [Mycobacteriaceae]|uniref:Uncharacterized protein n=1 Tax=Mycobacteroides salmoniphilum TaxID=404941 RepID=A0A4R8SZR9_9MYCO|nr:MULTISPECIES: hypothetical protein [Mycobacteriaceae]TDZ92699.1 hypothetical protein CCUG62472_03307 [Mycobacteroides salmoniphilum]TEA08521.1 hypothetical protein CCUG60884_01006 [Mycobacteroides salmoniphilum]
MRRMVAAAAATVALAGLLTIAPPSGVANADVCASAGRRVSVGGCANIADAVAPYVPPPAYYAPMPEDPPPPPPGSNVSACVHYNGRWVSAGGCNP